MHFCTYKEKFISLYCRLSSVLDLDALITQQALREAITDSEVATAKQRHQLILDYIQVRNPQQAPQTSSHHLGPVLSQSPRFSGGPDPPDPELFEPAQSCQSAPCIQQVWLWRLR